MAEKKGGSLRAAFLLGGLTHSNKMFSSDVGLLLDCQKGSMLTMTSVSAKLKEGWHML